MKFIHMTDAHVVAGGRLLYGADPIERLAAAVESINRDHADSDFVVITGDMTHWGELEAYEAFAAEIAKLCMPVHLLPGNHDEHTYIGRLFPDIPKDPDGFIQCTLRYNGTNLFLLDTTVQGEHYGRYCSARRAWLTEQLSITEGSVLLFLHHPPFAVGIPSMDDIRMQDADEFYECIAPHAARIQHLFFGHVHRMICGNWRGLSYSCMRGLNHQVTLDFVSPPAEIVGDLGSPAYGVVLVESDNVTVHCHEFLDTSPRFRLLSPDGNHDRYALEMRHACNQVPTSRQR